MKWNFAIYKKSEPPGIYRVLKQHQVRKNGKVTTQTLNFYFVRVPSRGQACTVAKSHSREEAERVFREHCPDWTGPIPYFERVQPSLKRRYKK